MQLMTISETLIKGLQFPAGSTIKVTKPLCEPPSFKLPNDAPFYVTNFKFLKSSKQWYLNTTCSDFAFITTLLALSRCCTVAFLILLLRSNKSKARSGLAWPATQPNCPMTDLRSFSSCSFKEVSFSPHFLFSIDWHCHFSDTKMANSILRLSLSHVGESVNKLPCFSSNPRATNLDFTTLFPLTNLTVLTQRTEIQSWLV